MSKDGCKEVGWIGRGPREELAVQRAPVCLREFNLVQDEWFGKGFK